MVETEKCEADFSVTEFAFMPFCGGLLTMAVMVLPKTLHAGDGRGSDGSGRAAPLVEIEPLSPAWYIKTIRLLLHACRARESYQIARRACRQLFGRRRDSWMSVQSAILAVIH